MPAAVPSCLAHCMGLPDFPDVSPGCAFVRRDSLRVGRVVVRLSRPTGMITVLLTF